MCDIFTVECTLLYIGINDYSISALDFSLTSSQDQVDIDLTAIDDDFLEDLEETFTVSLSRMMNQVNILTDIATAPQQVTIIDDEGIYSSNNRCMYKPVIAIVLANSKLSFNNFRLSYC